MKKLSEVPRNRKLRYGSEHWSTYLSEFCQRADPGECEVLAWQDLGYKHVRSLESTLYRAIERRASMCMVRVIDGVVYLVKL